MPVILISFCLIVNSEDSSSADIGSGEGSGEKDVVDVEGSGESTNDLNNDYDKKETKKIFPFIPLRPVSSNEGTNSVSKNEKGVLPKYNNGNGHFSSGTSNLHSQVSLFRAVASYLLPICIIWIGGLISEWL